MSEIVNLRIARKQKKRLVKEKQAQQNRLEFGRKKSEKQITSTINEKIKQALDGKKLTSPED